MSKIFETNFENSSLIDKISQNVGTISGTTIFKNLEKGCSLQLSSNKFIYYSAIKNVKQIELWIKPIKNNTTILKNNTINVVQITGNTIISTASKTTINFNNSILIFNKWNHILLEYNLGINFTNNIKFESNNICYIGLCSFNNIIQNNNDQGNLYSDFLNHKLLQRQTNIQSNITALKPNEINDVGLIAAYNFKSIGNKLPNIAWDNPANNYNARQYNGTIARCQTLKDGLSNGRFGNLLNYIEIPLVFDNKRTFSVCFTEYAYSNGGRVDVSFSYPQNNFGNSVLLFNLFGGAPIFIIGTTGSYIIPVNTRAQRNYWNTYVASINTQGRIFLYVNGVKIIDQNINVGTVTLSSSVKKLYLLQLDNAGSANSEKIILNDMKIYNRSITDIEAINYHNAFASKVVLHENFKQYSIKIKPNLNWQIKSGSWIVDEQTINNTNQYYIGQRYLKCTSSGIIYIQQKNAFGTFYCNNCKLLNNNDRIIFISNRPELNKQNGYAIERLNSTTLRLVSLTNGVSTSIISNVNLDLNNKLYDFKIMRNTDSVVGNLFIVLYKKSGQIIWNMLGNNTNNSTYFNSNYLSLQFGANSYISEIKIQQGVQV